MRCAFPTLAHLASLALLIACGTEPNALPSGVDAANQPAVSASRQRHGDDGFLLVGNLVQGGTTNGILRYDAGTGAFVDVVVPPGRGGVRGSCCMAVGPDGNLYVTAQGGTVVADRGVFRFNGATGAFIDVFVRGGSGGLVRPLVPVFGPDGNLYVGDIGTQSVRRYDGSTGAFIDEFVKSGSGGLSPGGDPQLFVFGPDDNLYVASFATDRILRFDGVTGAFLDEFVPKGRGGLVAPAGLTFGRDGNLYVGSRNPDTVLRYRGSTGRFRDVFVSAGSGGLSIPVGLVFGPDDNLYVANATSNGNGSVLRYHGRSGRFLDEFVPSGRGGISGPRVLVFTESGEDNQRSDAQSDDEDEGSDARHHRTHHH